MSVGDTGRLIEHVSGQHPGWGDLPVKRTSFGSAPAVERLANGDYGMFHWCCAFLPLGRNEGGTVEDGDAKEMSHTLQTLNLNSITEQVSLASI